MVLSIVFGRFNYFDTMQQASDSTGSTARRSNAVAKVKLICYKAATESVPYVCTVYRKLIRSA